MSPPRRCTRPPPRIAAATLVLFESIHGHHRGHPTEISPTACRAVVPPLVHRCESSSGADRVAGVFGQRSAPDLTTGRSHRVFWQGSCRPAATDPGYPGLRWCIHSPRNHVASAPVRCPGPRRGRIAGEDRVWPMHRAMLPGVLLGLPALVAANSRSPALVSAQVHSIWLIWPASVLMA